MAGENRITELREGLGLDRAALARKVKTSWQQITRLEKGERRLTQQWMQRISAALGVEPAALLPASPPLTSPPPLAGGGRSHAIDGVGASPPAQAPLALPDLAAWPRDLPVLGVTFGGADDAGDFTLNGEVIDFVRRPPAIASPEHGFALYVQGESMVPRYRPGDLVLVHKSRVARPGDIVVVELLGDNAPTGACLIKELSKRSARELMLRQYNPARDLKLAANRVKSIYRVLSMNEVVGFG